MVCPPGKARHNFLAVSGEFRGLYLASTPGMVSRLTHRYNRSPLSASPLQAVAITVDMLPTCLMVARRGRPASPSLPCEDAWACQWRGAIMEATPAFRQLELRFVDQIQWRYELIRPPGPF
jgi:hypothetical protein